VRQKIIFQTGEKKMFIKKTTIACVMSASLIFLVACGGGGSSNDTQQGNGDKTAPTLTEVSPITTPSHDNTPSYTFHSTEAGTISYGGSCNANTTTATEGDNSITFNQLVDGIYDNCTITVTDTASNTSTPLALSDFEVNTAVVFTDFSIEIHANTNNNDLGAFNISLSYPQASVSIDKTQGDVNAKGMSKGNDISGYSVMSNPEAASNQFRFAGITGSNFANGSNVHLITIHAKTSGAIPNTSIFTLTVNELVNELGQAITPQQLTIKIVP
jgi:hypothetical protein